MDFHDCSCSCPVETCFGCDSSSFPLLQRNALAIGLHFRWRRPHSQHLIVFFIHRFIQAAQYLQDKPLLGILADLGLSSDQLNDEKRGFSFRVNAPLHMRMDFKTGETCLDYLMNTPAQKLEEILRELGEERFSRRIAAAIVESRKTRSLPRTTQELAHLVIQAIPPNARHGRIHAATRTFQALRIAVNEELEELDCLLKNVILLLKPGGRAVMISFHSLEDRMVKHSVQKKKDFFKWVYKKPLQADEQEIRANPRARSAKMRVMERA